MIDRARLLHSVGALFAGALFTATAPATAQPLTYIPTTNLTPLQFGTTSFPIKQINDATTGPAAINGFGSNVTSGEITFSFATPMDLTNFSLWNNIVVDSQGGVKDFTLSFFNAAGTSLGQTSHQAPNAAPPFQAALSQTGVSSVVMNVASAYGRIEIREVQFSGQPSKPASFTQSCAEVRRLGYPVTTHTIQRSSNAVDRGAIVIGQGPGYSYAVGPLRAYGDSSLDRVFIDSFPLVPDRKKVCQIDVSVAGSTGSANNNDGISLFLPKAAGMAFRDQVGWDPAKGTSLRPSKALTDNLGPWTYNLSITSSNPTMAPPLAAALAGGVNALDIFVQDDSLVKSAKVTYSLY
ncbi:MAG TPA: hypothetical protein VF782_02785 [Allosphingosinicella sp.]|jgi:hypothetical protein